MSIFKTSFDVLIKTLIEYKEAQRISLCLIKEQLNRLCSAFGSCDFTDTVKAVASVFDIEANKKCPYPLFYTHQKIWYSIISRVDTSDPTEQGLAIAFEDHPVTPNFVLSGQLIIGKTSFDLVGSNLTSAVDVVRTIDETLSDKCKDEPCISPTATNIFQITLPAPINLTLFVYNGVGYLPSQSFSTSVASIATEINNDPIISQYVKATAVSQTNTEGVLRLDVLDGYNIGVFGASSLSWLTRNSTIVRTISLNSEIAYTITGFVEVYASQKFRLRNLNPAVAAGNPNPPTSKCSTDKFICRYCPEYKPVKSLIYKCNVLFTATMPMIPLTALMRTLPKSNLDRLRSCICNLISLIDLYQSHIDNDLIDLCYLQKSLVTGCSAPNKCT